MAYSYSSGWYRRYYQVVAPVLKDRKTQAYSMVVLSLFTMSFFGFFAIRPTLKTIATLQKQIEDRTYVDKQLEDKINALISAQDEYHRVEPYIPQIYSLLPQTPDVTTLLIKMENLAGSNSANIVSVNFDSLVLYGSKKAAPKPLKVQGQSSDVLAAENSTTTPFSFTVTFEGTFTQLVDVLSRLTKLDRIITINNADFKLGGGSASGSAHLAVDLTTNAYYFPLQ